ncbi:hypothetical protein NMY22_g555 [Coprinellus aureogranulatus]|nr:hypothetical protein NMY22_g555 [Coprinellus aureogranulatus]
MGRRGSLSYWGNDGLQEVFESLVSRDPAKAFTAGQWMTERPGGSDVSLTETVARPLGERHRYGEVYSLNGMKWFSSATDSEISLALARTGSEELGARGLSLFLVPLRLPLFPKQSEPRPAPTSNNIFVHRLKDKIGTHALPTAELSLEGTKGYLISPLNQGVKSIAPVLNITRVWSAVTSCGHLRKCLEIATSYATVRRVKSDTLLLADNPIHVERLAKISVLYRALTHMVFGAVRLMGKVECSGLKGAEQEALRLRMLTPVVKAFAAEKASAGIEEAIAALGGAGYMEENGMGRALRDAMVEKIWEGTVVVLALDLTRATQDSKVLHAFTHWAEGVMASCPTELLKALPAVAATLREAISRVKCAYTTPVHPMIHRPGLILVGYLASSLSLLEHAVWSWTQRKETREVDVEVLRRWVLEDAFGAALEELKTMVESGSEKVEFDKQIALGASPSLHRKVKL